MLSFLEILGTIGGNVLSLPGIIGLGLGMATRNWFLAALMGAGIGIFESLLFEGFRLSEVGLADLLIATVVGVIAALVGCAVRHKGATV